MRIGKRSNWYFFIFQLKPIFTSLAMKSDTTNNNDPELNWPSTNPNWNIPISNLPNFDDRLMKRRWENSILQMTKPFSKTKQRIKEQRHSIQLTIFWLHNDTKLNWVNFLSWASFNSKYKSGSAKPRWQNENKSSKPLQSSIVP